MTTIKIGTFRGGANLKSVVIPSSVTRIDESAFMGCTDLEKIEVEAGKKDAFEYKLPPTGEKPDIYLGTLIEEQAPVEKKKKK